ncbi:MAG: hypothetical protein GTN76_04530, partial [Candidatus Aenigmarchaeota archaeon]|nr:hypothetical protein [Candidatus Aenigmarchaeota archaeon]
KARNMVKHWKAVTEEKETVEVLIELMEQVRNSSDEIGRFKEFLSQRIAEGKERIEPRWFTILTNKLRDMQSALDKASIMIRPYTIDKRLFETISEKYSSLTLSALQVEKAFMSENRDQINISLSNLQQAKSEIDKALSDVSQGLEDWYSRITLKTICT